MRIDPVIETLLGLEQGSLTKDTSGAPYPTRLAPDGTSQLIVIPAGLLDGLIWVGPEEAIDRLMYPLNRARATVGRYIREGRYPRRLSPDGKNWAIGLPAGTLLAPIDELRMADAKIARLEGDLVEARSEEGRHREREAEAHADLTEVRARNHRLIARLEDEVFYRYYLAIELREMADALSRSQELLTYLASRSRGIKASMAVWIVVAIAASIFGTILMQRLFPDTLLQ